MPNMISIISSCCSDFTEKSLNMVNTCTCIIQVIYVEYNINEPMRNKFELFLVHD